ncbi:MAG: hydrogenase maturation nickel metallochaperone HypA [Terriglobales bacterium]
MHELSLAMSLLDGVEEECAARGGLHVRAVHLRVGALSGVSIDALTFSYQVASADTALAGTRLLVEESAGRELEMIGLEVDP